MTADDHDDRVERRNLTGLAAGASSGGTLGLLLAATFAQPVSAVLAVISVILGAAAGALLGRWVAGRVSIDDWDPRASDRPFVGIHTPDEDDTPEAPPRGMAPRQA
jgi:hypothetical protein